jgi:glycosyltransferase involved in cell wall biosynthesis
MAKRPSQPRSQPIRIVSVMSTYCDPGWCGSGVALAATQTVFALAKRGHLVNVFCPVLDLDQGFEFPAENPAQFLDEKLTIHYGRDHKHTDNGPTEAGLAKTLGPLMDSQKTDMVLLHGWHSPMLERAAKMAKAAGLPYIVHLHDALTPSKLTMSGFFRKRYVNNHVIPFMRDAANVITPTEDVSKAIQEWDWQVPVEVCVTGVDSGALLRQKYARLVDEPYILFMGNLSKENNLQFLLEAFAQCAEKIDPWKLVLAGRDTDSQSAALTKTIAKLKLGERVVQMGFVSAEQKTSLLQNAGLFALTTNVPGVHIALLEALACGVPVLVSPEGNVPDIEEGKAGSTLALETDRWSKAFSQLSQTSELRRRLGLNAHQLYIENHNLDTAMERLIQILRRIKIQSRAGKDPE